nr:hypothetical protein [Paenibacillus sp. J31TS4]
MFFTPMQINLLGFKVNTVDNSSVVNAGSLQYIDQFVSYKRNQAFGELNGDLSPTSLPISNVTDPDVIDSASNKTSAI